MLQGIVWSTTHKKAEKRDKWVPILPIFMLRFQEPTVRATARGKTGNPGFPYGGEGCDCIPVQSHILLYLLHFLQHFYGLYGFPLPPPRV